MPIFYLNESQFSYEKYKSYMKTNRGEISRAIYKAINICYPEYKDKFSFRPTFKLSNHPDGLIADFDFNKYCNTKNRSTKIDIVDFLRDVESEVEYTLDNLNSSYISSYSSTNHPTSIIFIER